MKIDNPASPPLEKGGWGDLKVIFNVIKVDLLGLKVKEALRYLENAKEILRGIPFEDSTYEDVKPVQEACGTAYLAVLKAIDEYMLKKGFDEKELSQSVDGYRDIIRKYLMINNDKLLKEFEKLYKLLHIAGYYRGLLEDVTVVKNALKAAKIFIEKIR